MPAHAHPQVACGRHGVMGPVVRTRRPTHVRRSRAGATEHRPGGAHVPAHALPYVATGDWLTIRPGWPHVRNT
ncbi:MAG: hypothetical protein AAGI01_08155, partial [Myxococcota bacterium]